MHSNRIDGVLFHLHTLYLFTIDDFISIVIPNATCGITLPLASGLLQRPASVRDIIPEVPLVVFWVWTNLLLFNMCNQTRPGAILEDSVNKPWRPMVSGRISAQSVQYHIVVTRLGLIGISLALGGIVPCVVLQLLTFWYNDLDGGETWFLRNCINAGGYLCFIIGGMQVAMRSQILNLSDGGVTWFIWTSAIIALTMHTQDLYDQEGDKLRNRKTIPLVFGDYFARCSIALPTVVWSLIAPTFWTSSLVGFLPSVALGTIVTMRLFKKGEPDIQYDRRTFICWNAWIISIHMLPVWTQLLSCREPHA